MTGKYEFLVGVDEVGRGPLAGPVTVGVVKVPLDFDWSQIRGVRDSKQVTEGERERIAAEALLLKRAGKLDYAIGQCSAEVIDEKGIVFAIKTAQAQAFKKLSLSPQNCFIKLDGSLSAPGEFAQETIIKGDQKESSISLASIVAKVARDRYMRQIAKQFAAYGFAAHKGYGTKAHREAIARYGLSTLHRRSYCKNIITLYS